MFFFIHISVSVISNYHEIDHAPMHKPMYAPTHKTMYASMHLCTHHTYTLIKPTNHNAHNNCSHTKITIEPNN